MEDLRENIRIYIFFMDEGHKFVFFVLFCFFVFLYLISKDSFIVPEVRIVFYKMHSDFEILQI